MVILGKLAIKGKLEMQNRVRKGVSIGLFRVKAPAGARKKEKNIIGP